jgi:hypothetical protein
MASIVHIVDVEAGESKEAEKLALKPGFQFNTYDLMKVFAIVTMMIDHFGLFGFGRSIMWRLVGRASAPCFYFLVGCSNSYVVKPKMIFWAIVLGFVSYCYGLIIPLNNSLNAIIMCKIILLYVPFGKFPSWALLPIQAALIAANPYVGPYVEYGTISLLHAVGGMLVINKHWHRFIWIPATCIYHCYRCKPFYTWRRHHNDYPIGYATFTILTIVFVMFKMHVFGPYRTRTLAILAVIIRWISVHSLEIYVLHLIAYKFHSVHMRIWEIESTDYEFD